MEGDRAATAVLALTIFAVVCSLAASYATDSAEDAEVRLGDLAVYGSLAAPGVSIDEYGGVATLYYEAGGDVEWRLKALDSTYCVSDGGSYRVRGYDDIAVTGSVLKVDEPGRYAVKLYESGHEVRSGTMVLDGTVERTFEWTQDTPSGRYTYSVKFEYPFSEYMGYADDRSSPRHQSDAYPEERFIQTRGLEDLEEALGSEYEKVRGVPARAGAQDYADYLLSFVQCCIAYPDTIVRTDDGFAYDEGGSGDLYIYGEREYWAYPLETIHRGYGDCEDTSFLAAALFVGAGYTAAVATLPGHMIAGVVLDDFAPRGPGMNFRAVKHIPSIDANLFFCETSSEEALPTGYLPENVYIEAMGLGSITLVKGAA